MDNNIKFSSQSDSEMEEAQKKAQETFKYFWKELSWENRRIIPALNVACLKIAFKYPKGKEHMWVDDIDFSSWEKISGVLMNEPNWVSLKQWDKVEVNVEDISDWMYANAMDWKVYGAFTVNLIRSRMSEQERQQHDKAWWLNFGNPNEIKIIPESEKKKSIFSFFKNPKKDDSNLTKEHPMCINTENQFREQLKKSKEMVELRDNFENTLLHAEALAWNGLMVKALLDNWADKNAKNKYWKTPLNFAKQMKWDNIIKILENS